MVKNQPKKLFLISTGNIKNKQLFDLIRNNSIIISEMLKRKNFLELTNSGIIN
jgi:predicted nuclease of predicted toxin-antitoxin system